MIEWFGDAPSKREKKNIYIYISWDVKKTCALISIANEAKQSYNKTVSLKPALFSPLLKWMEHWNNG